MKHQIVLLLLLTVLSPIYNGVNAQNKPNILWVLTDDQRFDSIRAFNKMTTGKEMSELGYVESPNVDRLAEMGTTFINTYCQSPACAPSRTAMHLGRYPFRSGIFEFEYYNNKAAHFQPTLPEQMEQLGYQTLHIGKLGVRIRTLKNGRAVKHQIYQTDIDFKKLAEEGFTDWGKMWAKEVEGEKLDTPIKNLEFFVTEEGKFEYVSKELEESRPQYKGSGAAAMKKYDLLRQYNEKKGPQTPFSPGILAGVSSRKSGNTRDGFYAQIFEAYLNNLEGDYTIGSQSFDKIDESKPLFCHIGFDFPHTPVLPPKEYAERFEKYDYQIPQFDASSEFEKMPKQLKQQVKQAYTDHFTDAEKLKMIQYYYAFCAYGDQLIGQSVDAFIDYSEKRNQEWMIVYVCGDHGWKLNDHGSVSKFSPWEVDVHNPIIVVSSDKKKFPKGKVVEDFTEFVDVAPTILASGGADLEHASFHYLDGLNLAKVAAEEAPKRDYVIGESHAVTGPRAFIRTKEYMFSLKVRPNKKRGENMEWARNASDKELDMCLYAIKDDPKEVNNLAYNKKYQSITKVMKKKLIDIVLGDNRVEVQWGKKADGTKVFRSKFAEGAHDYRLKIKGNL
ncbi:sulfatase-like hydrolase/transferase [Flammeovirga yaeyamensis]|uniref:Sulfatase-like hydrolase/transferase n=1 Tax=Flammeovirga yaeyamensis TaxID=367791 RepID=A0AAX1NDW4_9BACT|nr:sulfatase-like hydrolase/transferase [Flammeovirga yaeyamensis]MBB3696853.1 arylsulfatase A-like enzyme [Flammeovirga yaeyamensis]NMF33519.1 sulfatase-like hydrolase/transferase [Flammeovirga yaeyamensis]QWG05211.1 sulfatase-like hydrolase/transferase [Flammeovirga yaeyamensis]